jgi:putative ABC transport system permease protein
MTLWSDLRRAILALRREPMLPVAATLTLAIAIGANTAVFSIVDAILVRPLPYPHSDRLYWIAERTQRSPAGVGYAADYYSLRERQRAFEDVAALAWGDMNWSGPGRPEYLQAAQVSPSFFSIMGTQPLLGRYLAPGEEGSKAPPIVVLNYVFWRNRLGGDAHVAGKSIVLGGQSRTIVGVMPQGFDYPPGTQLWKPLEIDEATQRPRLVTRPLRLVSMVARSRRGVDAQALEGEMARLTGEIHGEYPSGFDARGFLKGFQIVATPLQRQLTGDLRPALLAIGGSVGLVLLIACVNLANLLLAHGTTRQRDIAVRLALGSGRRRIFGQTILESLALALPGGAAGVAIATLAVYVLNTLKPAVLLRYPAIALDRRILAFTFTLTFVTGVLFGLAPAFAAGRVSIQDALKAAGHAYSGSRSSARFRRMLVVAELAVSLVLLIGAGLLARSFVNLAHIELGFPPDHLLTFQVNPAGSPVARAQYYADALSRLQRLPMVRSAAISTHLPVTDWGWAGNRVQVLSRPPVPLAEQPIVDLAAASREFFPTIGLPLKNGRFFDLSDTFQTPVRVVVNEAFVRRIFPGEDPVGRRIGYGPNPKPWTIIGVAGDFRASALGADPTPLIYLCTCQTGADAPFRFVLRTLSDPQSAIRAVEEQVYSVDRNQPIFDVKTMQERIDLALAPQKFQLVLIGAFAGIAILLAAAGVYGVMSYLVGRRTREIGIRMAMGATPASVMRLVLGETSALTAMALIAGIGGAWALTRYMKALLYGVTELDALTFAAAGALLAVIVLCAGLAPAGRAAKIDPLTALREE